MSLEHQNSWIDARFICQDSDAARRLTRAMRKAGAAHVMIRQSAVWSIWADTVKNRSFVESLQAENQTERIAFARAGDPMRIWAKPVSSEIGPGLCLAAAGSGIDADPSTVIIDPLTAFGSGEHPSTWLNLALLAEFFNGGVGPIPAPGSWAADIGAGTGVLALAMALKGNLKVLAVDPDPAARRACQRNQALNPLAGPLVHFAQGTHECVRGRYGLVAANLPGPLLIALGRDLAAITAPGGCLVTSGFRNEAEPDIIEAFSRAAMRPLRRNRRLGWSGVIFTTV